MIGATNRQSSLFYTPLARQAVLLKDDLLDPVDTLLDDSELVSFVRQRLASRRPLSARTGRPGLACFVVVSSSTSRDGHSGSWSVSSAAT